MVTAFPWASLPVVGRDDGRLAAWIAAIGWTWRGSTTAVAGDGVIVEIASAGARGWIAVPARVARGIADVALDRGAELAAPRPITPVERALAALVIADAVARVDPHATVALIDAVPAGDHVAARIAIERPIVGELIAIGSPWPIAAPRVDLQRAMHLPAVRCAIAAAQARVDPARLRGLAAGDVVVVGPPSAGLAVGRGSIAATLDRASGVATVAGRYAREATMPDDPDQRLADDLRISLTIVVGEVELPVRELLALAPGQTVSLGRPVGGAVELRAGGRLVGRGELVVVDGDLGVRLIEVLSTTPSAC